ncbi:MAG: HAD-IIIA family hydrolase [Flavobacteriaceae bacterium]|nr:HAD-IIIA family hydrolase [Flavobacteriaceae bacterium]MDG1961552.1 HAD-IIIA family hydrolase [Flavobacteriaceae bacterium]
MLEKSYKTILHQVKAFIFDVDGVLTDGTVVVDTNGELLRNMNIKDGFALKTAIDKGYLICIISGGINPGVKVRLEALGVTDVHLGAHFKEEILTQFIEKHNLSADQACYMGDDLPDYGVMKRVGLACCPQDAVAEIKSIAHYVSHKSGGQGCVRDIIEQVLKVQGNWFSGRPVSGREG